MAEKKGKKKQNTVYRKEANTEFHKGADNAFTGGGNASYQPRDSGTGKPGRGSDGKRQTEKSMQAQQETFGQKSRSPKRASREKTVRLQRIKAWILGAAMPDSVNRTMLQRFRQESRCTGTLLDKKSKSPMQSRGRKKSRICKGKQHFYRAGEFQPAGGNREETDGCGRLPPEGHLQAVAEKGEIP